MGLNILRPSAKVTHQPTFPEASNTIGAIIFVAYILAAIALTGSICRDLINAYVYLPKKLREKPGLQRNLTIFSTIALISFSVLSYHMFDYLLVSYSSWASDHSIALPQAVYGKDGLLGPKGQRVPVYIWTWLRSSTLFTDFAKTICAPQSHALWTTQALFATAMWNVVLTLEGPWRQIPHVWSYIMISQILPVSFSQNLFFLAFLMKDITRAPKQAWTPQTILITAPLCAFNVLVLLAPRSVSSPYFLAMVGSIRLLISSPFIAATLLPASTGKEIGVLEIRSRKHAFLGMLTVMALVVTGVHLKSFFASGGSFRRLVDAINDDPSVSALGYDYLIAAVSAVFWHTLADEPPQLSLPIKPIAKDA